MKVLLIAYECSPYVGSEWGVGWGRLVGAAKVAETSVLTSAANFSHLERACAEGLMPSNVQFFTPEPDDKLRSLEKTTGAFAYNYEAYHHWHTLALPLMRRLHSEEAFDVVHQVNVCTFREPGYGLELGIPFLWGPIGGSQNFPWRFLAALSWKEAGKEALRSVANGLTLRRERIRSAARRSTLVLAANSTNQRDFERAFECPVELLLETGIHAVQSPDRGRFEKRIELRMTAQPAPPLRIVWSGELHTRKALPVLLRALARVRPEIEWELDVLGGGGMEASWKRETQKLGFGKRVRFLGRLAYPDAVAALQTADVLCFTSLRDTSGNVVLEALAAGIPVLCFDHQGCGDIVDDTCGIKIPVTTPRLAYAAWAEALEELVDTPGRLLELSYGATVRAHHFLWSRNHDHINGLYRKYARVGGAVRTTPTPVAAKQVEEIEVGLV